MINEYIGYGQELQGKITVSSKVRSNNLDGSIFEIPEIIFYSYLIYKKKN